jgi:hypothetical protein
MRFILSSRILYLISLTVLHRVVVDGSWVLVGLLILEMRFWAGYRIAYVNDLRCGFLGRSTELLCSIIIIAKCIKRVFYPRVKKKLYLTTFRYESKIFMWKGFSTFSLQCFSWPW